MRALKYPVNRSEFSIHNGYEEKEGREWLMLAIS